MCSLMPFYTVTFPFIIYYDLTFKKDVKGPFFLIFWFVSLERQMIRVTFDPTFGKW